MECYQCASADEWKCYNPKLVTDYLKPKSCDYVFEAQYCVKTIGRYGGSFNSFFGLNICCMFAIARFFVVFFFNNSSKISPKIIFNFEKFLPLFARIEIIYRIQIELHIWSLMCFYCLKCCVALSNV